MRGAQRSSLTKLGCFAAQTSGGLTGARARPTPGRRLSRCPAHRGPTGTPPPPSGRAGQMDGEARGGMLRSKSGSLGPRHPRQHPPGLEALHTLRGENTGWLFGVLIPAIRERCNNRDGGTGGREA